MYIGEKTHSEIENNYQRSLFEIATGDGSVWGVISAERLRHQLRQTFSHVARRQVFPERLLSLMYANASFLTWGKIREKKLGYASIINPFRRMVKDRAGVASYEQLVQEQSYGVSLGQFGEIRDDVMSFYRGFKFRDPAGRVIGVPEIKVSMEAVQKLSESIRLAMGLDEKKLRVGEVKHPMALGAGDCVYLGLNPGEGRKGVVKYIYSVLLHEYGHALLRQNVDVMTNAAIDESIAMFFDLALGRTEAMGLYISRTLREEGVVDVDERAIVDHLLSRQPNALRAHADPLTYMPAVFLSAAFEEAMINNPSKVPEGLQVWDELAEKYGVSDAMRKEGPLQDMQPFTGETCGRLPGYALGIIMAFILFKKFDADVGAHWQLELARGNFEPVISWFEENVFPHANCNDPNTFIQKVTGAPMSTELYKEEMTLRYGIAA